MPVVTVDPDAYERFELSTAPADPDNPNDEAGYVYLRPLPYGMKLSRRSNATKMSMRAQPAQNRKQAQSQEQVFEVATMDEWAVAFDFAYCIGEHNLTDAKGNKIDFQQHTHMKIKMLNPKVGTEIETLIDNLNNGEDEESFEDFLRRQNTSSSEETNSSSQDGNETMTEEPLPTV